MTAPSTTISAVELYTPLDLAERVREILGVINLDPATDASRQAASWIREILMRGLGRQELAQVAQILPLTNLRHLRDVLENLNTAEALFG